MEGLEVGRSQSSIQIWTNEKQKRILRGRERESSWINFWIIFCPGRTMKVVLWKGLDLHILCILFTLFFWTGGGRNMR
jgi:hypothetical protein